LFALLAGTVESAKHRTEPTQDHQVGHCAGDGSAQSTAWAHLATHLRPVQWTADTGWYCSWFWWVACQSGWHAARHSRCTHCEQTVDVFSLLNCTLFIWCVQHQIVISFFLAVN